MVFDDFKKGIMTYIDREFCNKLSNGDWRKWAIPFVSQLAIPWVEKMYSNNLDLLKATNLVDDSGCIDLETIYSTLKNVSVTQGDIVYPLPLLGKTTFNTSDVDTLYRIMKNVNL